MADISLTLEGDVNAGRGQLGYTEFISLTTTPANLWDISDKKPYRFYITPDATNKIVRLPEIGEGDENAKVGHTIFITNNSGAETLTVQNSSGGLVKLIPVMSSIILSAKSAIDTWEDITIASGGGAGETNTASNQGVSGVGPFDSKVGVDLQFRNINAGSNKVSVALDGANKEIDLDVVEANIDINALSGAPVGDVVGTTDVQTLTNKTIDSTTNTVTADNVRTLTGIVDVNSSAAPSVGQTLVATSATTATWQNQLTRASYSIQSLEVNASKVEWTTIGHFSWNNSKYGTSGANYTAGEVVFEAVISNRNLGIRAYNITTASVIGSAAVVASGFTSFAVASPTADARIAIQVRKIADGGINPRVFGIQMEFNSSG